MKSPKLSLPHLTSSHFHGGFLFPTLKFAKVHRKVGVFCELKSERSSSVSDCGIDFSDPDWKAKFQKDFEDRFRLPHITDVFPDHIPIPSTFCLKMRLVFLLVLF